MRPKVSVIIPVWNQEELITRALLSIPKREDIQVIVINDASTDDTCLSIAHFDMEYGQEFYEFLYLKEYKTEFLCDKEATFAFAKGLINYYTGQYDDAYDDFYDAMESDPNNDIYSFYLGCASYKLEDFMEAMSFFNRAIRKSSKKNAYYYFWRALARYRNANYSQAVNEFKKAVKLDPNNEIYTSWLNFAVYDENTYDHPRNYLG